jgi:Fe2+ transport system protein B
LTDLANPLEARTEPFSKTKVDQLTLQPVTGVSLFVMTLFIPFETTLNVAYTIPMNHRLVDQAHLLDKTEFGTSIAEGVYLDATCKWP